MDALIPGQKSREPKQPNRKIDEELYPKNPRAVRGALPGWWRTAEEDTASTPAHTQRQRQVQQCTMRTQPSRAWSHPRDGCGRLLARAIARAARAERGEHTAEHAQAKHHEESTTATGGHSGYQIGIEVACSVKRTLSGVACRFAGSLGRRELRQERAGQWHSGKRTVNARTPRPCGARSSLQC